MDSEASRRNLFQFAELEINRNLHFNMGCSRSKDDPTVPSGRRSFVVDCWVTSKIKNRNYSKMNPPNLIKI